MPHVAIVGAGLIGLACARDALKAGWNVTLIDRRFEGDRASHGNAAGLGISEVTPMAVSAFSLQALRWLMDPLGPLAVRWSQVPAMIPWALAFQRMQNRRNFLDASHALAYLMRTVYDDFVPMLRDLDMESQLHRDGALTLYETEATYQAEQKNWQLKRELGVAWRDVSAEELAALEPGLAPIFKRAIMIEDWSTVDDPKAIVEGLRRYAQRHGARLLEAKAAHLAVDQLARPAVVTADGQRIEADRVVVAAGAWSQPLAASIGDRILIEAERGYSVTLPNSRDVLKREVIFAERSFVASPLSIGLRVGGTAEFAHADAKPNYKRSEALLKLARLYFPKLDQSGADHWMGARPTTPDSVPVIGASTTCPKVLYACGHGHVGLTLSATTGRLVAELLNNSDAPDGRLAAYSPARFTARASSGQSRQPTA